MSRYKTTHDTRLTKTKQRVKITVFNTYD